MVLTKPPGMFRANKNAVKMTCIWLVVALCIITPPAAVFMIVWWANR